MSALSGARAARLERARKIAELNRQGLTDAAIAAALGCSIDVVTRTLDAPVREVLR